MKGVAIKGVKELEIKEVEEPKNKSGKLTIQVLKTGICGSDIHYWDIGYPAGLVMGHEFCGIVLDNGGVEEFSKGDRITALPISPCGVCDACKSGNPQYCRLTWSEAVGLSLDNPGGFTPRINVRSDLSFKVPDEVTDEEAAMVEPTAVGLHAVDLTNIKVGDTVLVIGGGIIGLVSAMFAKMQGASLVIVSETNKLRGEKAVKLGVADEWIDALDKDVLNKMNEKSNGGFDHVIECCGNSPAVTTAISAVKPGGTVVLVGVSMGPIEVPTLVAVMSEITLKGAIGYTKEEFKKCLDMMASKQIDVTKFISEIVGLEEVQGAFEKLSSGNSDAIKILVDPSEDTI